jgi:hypothetical protein
MTDTAALEEILSKFSGNKIDSKEFLNLLLTSDENGIDYLQNLKKEFKDNYVNPVFKKVTDHYKKLDNKLKDEKSKKEILEAINDPLDVVNLNKEYREKTKKILDKKLKDLSDNIRTDAETNTSNAVKSSVLSSILPKTQPQVNEEQKTFTPKENVVSLSENTINKLVDIFGGLNSKVLKTEQTTDQTGSGGGFLESLGKFLLVGGVAAGLISMFWDSHIKPWLEEKLDMKLGFLDRFEGTIEGISKFFTLGGLKLTGGWLFNIVGKAFTSFGDMLEGSLNAIFKLGFGDEVVEQGAKAAPSVWKTLLPKVAGGLFKGVGLAALKAIPIVGALISFYFAYDRFQKNDTIGGIIDVLNGIVGFIPGAGVPLSLGLSALNAFLDYKAGDIKGVEGQQSMKMDYVNKITDYISNIPLIGGIISSIVGFVEFAGGLGSNDTSSVKGGLNKMSKFPLFGIFPSIMLSLLDASTNKNNEFTGLDVGKFISNLRQSTLKTVLSWFPEWFGIRHKIADFMGIKLDGEYKDSFAILETPEQKQNAIKAEKEKEKLKNTPYESGSAIEKQALKTNVEDLQKRLDSKEKELSEVARKINSSRSDMPSKEDKNSLDRLNSEITSLKRVISRTKETQEKYSEIFQNGINTTIPKNNPFADKIKEPTFKEFQENPQNFNSINQKDFSFQSLMTNSSNNSILFDKNTNTANILDKEDNILAYKKDGVFDLALQELTKLVASINKGIYKIPESLENIPNQAPVVVSGGGQQSDNSMAYVLGGARDPIYEFRRSFRTS